jgi:hypothetical protein
MRGVLDDLRQGVRALVRAPGFCALALATLALGIGGTAAMFSVVYGVLFRPLPFAAPEQLVRVWQTSAGDGQRGSFSAGVFLDLQRDARSLSGAAGYMNSFAGVSLGNDPRTSSRCSAPRRRAVGSSPRPQIGRARRWSSSPTAPGARISAPTRKCSAVRCASTDSPTRWSG